MYLTERVKKQIQVKNKKQEVKTGISDRFCSFHALFILLPLITHNSHDSPLLLPTISILPCPTLSPLAPAPPPATAQKGRDYC